MSAWNEFRDSVLKGVGVPTGIDLGGAGIPDATANAAGAQAGNGVVQLATNAISNLFHGNAAGTAGTPQATANTVAKVSMGTLVLIGACAYFLLRKKR